MLRAVKLDAVSTETPVPIHSDIVISPVKTDIPDAIHCEKRWLTPKRLEADCQSRTRTRRPDNV